ncbi:hypothetical protein IFM89_018981 [Coptis chinensis]|uniref:Probable purine permease n=1 Tax=Coptis chinensis TaxID=261450 RepID=A0A835M3Z8_9MAGN|nr:hypothetical protein IFM89_018981 [Coptis chinensis]
MSSALNIEEGTTTPEQAASTQNIPNTKKSINWPLLYLSCTLVAIGATGGPLLTRLYYRHGGDRRWIATSMQTAGFPILFLPLFVFYLQSRRQGVKLSMFFMEPKLFWLSFTIGVLLGLEIDLHAGGLSDTPVSTSSMVFSSQIIFLAVFALLIVKQKFTAYSIISVILVTLGLALSGLAANGDRPADTSDVEYYLGLFLVLASAALLGLIWPLIERAYSKAKRPVNYVIVLQFQINVAIFATLFNVIGLAIQRDQFDIVSLEASKYGLGNGMYYFVLIAGAVVWQLLYIGGLGVIFCFNSLFTGILAAIFLPITSIIAVIAYDDKFNGLMVVSLLICLLGFTSYLLGEYRTNKKKSYPMTQVGDNNPSNDVASSV